MRVQSYTNIIPRLLYVELYTVVQCSFTIKYFVLIRFRIIIGFKNNCVFLYYTVFRFNSLFYTGNHSVPNFFIRSCRFSVYRGYVLVRFYCIVELSLMLFVCTQLWHPQKHYQDSHMELFIFGYE